MIPTRLLVHLALFLVSVGAARAESDPERVRGFIGRFLKEREAPRSHHVIRRSETFSRGVRSVRTDEFIADGEARYWKLEEQTAPQEPPRVVDFLMMRDSDGRLMRWETDCPARVVEPGRSHLADPLGFLGYPASNCTGLSWEVQGERAVLDFTEPSGRRHHAVLNLKRGDVAESVVTGPEPGSVQRTWVERFDAGPRIDPAFFGSLRNRLDENARQASRRAAVSGWAAWLSTLVGWLLPVGVGLGRYRARLLAPTGAKMLLGVAAFVCGPPVVFWALTEVAQGLLPMLLTAMTWPLVQALPRDTALVASQGLNALLLSGIVSVVTYGVLALAVLRRQRAAGV